jgi:hypothetical protein
MQLQLQSYSFLVMGNLQLPRGMVTLVQVDKERPHMMAAEAEAQEVQHQAEMVVQV